MYRQHEGWSEHSVSARYDFDDDQRQWLADSAQHCLVCKTVGQGVNFATETMFVG